MKFDHFPYPPLEILDKFDIAFSAGVKAGRAGKLYTDCPHGLPLDPEWTQENLVCLEDPDIAGWLMGWWISSYFLDIGESVERLNGAGDMAAFLWVGCQRDIVDDFNEAMALVSSAPKEFIARLLVGKFND